MFEKQVHAAPSTQKSVLKCCQGDDEINQGLKWVSGIGLGQVKSDYLGLSQVKTVQAAMQATFVLNLG